MKKKNCTMEKGSPDVTEKELSLKKVTTIINKDIVYSNEISLTLSMSIFDAIRILPIRNKIRKGIYNYIKNKKQQAERQELT